MFWICYIYCMDTLRGLPRSLSTGADLNLLKVLVALLDTRSVTAAGSALGLTQSAASSALKRLRDLCGDPLFVRTPRGMDPTPFALRFGEDVRASLKTLDASFTRQSGFDPAHAARSFRLALSDVGEFVFLPPLIAAAAAAGPHLSMQTEAVPRETLGTALAEGRIDLAIGVLPLMKGGIRQTTLFRESLVLLARAGHPLAKRPTPAGFLAARHLVVAPRETQHYSAEGLLVELGAAAQIAVRVPHFLAVPRIIEASDLVVILPRMIARLFAASGSLVWRELPVDSPTLEVRLCWHQLFEEEPANRWLRGHCLRLFARNGKAEAAE
jgi:DNA-binding transcriptional LysR family regulator